jgi:ribosomal protein L31E
MQIKVSGVLIQNIENDTIWNRTRRNMEHLSIKLKDSTNEEYKEQYNEGTSKI